MNGTIVFKGSNSGPVEVGPEDIQAFVSGEIVPRIADMYVQHGMPRRGLVSFTMNISEGGTVRIVGPNLCRRAGTASSARERT
jgi:hypothetical protein